MNKLYEYLLGIVQDQFSEDKINNYTKEQVTDMVYVLTTEQGLTENNFSEEDAKDIISSSIDEVSEFCNISQEDLTLFEAMYAAEVEHQIEFSDNDTEIIRNEFSQSTFSEDEHSPEDCAKAIVANYISQEEFSDKLPLLSKRDSKTIKRDLKNLAETMGVYKKKSLGERLKDRILFRTPNSTVGKGYAAAKTVVNSPMGQLGAALAYQNLQMKAANTTNKIMAKAQNQMLASAAISELEEVIFSEEVQVNEMSHATDLQNQEDANIGNLTADWTQALEECINTNSAVTQGQLEPQAHFSEDDDYQDEYAIKTPAATQKPMLSFGNGYFKTKPEDDVRPGILGSGREFVEWRKNLLDKTNELKKPMYKSKTGGFALNKNFMGLLSGAMQDAVAEGILTGVYYQSLDTGLKIGSGTVARGYKGVEAIMKPTFDKLQSKLETAGSNMANWLMPDGPSASEIIDGMTDKDAIEIIKTLDQSGWLSKLNESTRDVFLMNLSKSGICYIDEKGTLKKRNIVDKLIASYQRNPDRFLEELPSRLDEIKDIYKATALISKDSINTESVYNRLKTAASEDQVRQILNDELNVVRKPLVSLSDLAISLSNDFITLMKTDKIYYKTLINKIARSVETLAREKGDDSISGISRSFLRGLALSETESEVKRTVEKLLVANIKYLNEMVNVSDSEFAEELDVQGANIHMDNSPVLSTGGRSNITPANLGRTAGWSDEEQDAAEESTSTDVLNEMKEGQTTTFASDEYSSDDYFSQSSSATSSASDKVSAPGFGVDAYSKA